MVRHSAAATRPCSAKQWLGAAVRRSVLGWNLSVEAVAARPARPAWLARQVREARGAEAEEALVAPAREVSVELPDPGPQVGDEAHSHPFTVPQLVPQ